MGEVSEVLRVGLAGAGLMGERRARFVSEDPYATLVAIADVNRDRAVRGARRWGAEECLITSNWEEIISLEQIDVLIVSTINKFLAPISIAALRSGKHVLCEKPFGRNLKEVQQLAEEVARSGRVFKAALNHRYHPAIRQAHQLLQEKRIGEPLYARCVYGHGGRPDYDKEWRFNPELSGGGQLLDQGVHALDLFCWFLGDFNEVFSSTASYFWQVKPMEDNAFVLLRADNGKAAILHTSCTQWKNRFDFEVYGRDGYLRVQGLGGSYGLESLTLGLRDLESRPPEETKWDYSGPDLTWFDEWEELKSAIRGERESLIGINDGLKVMNLVDAIYRSANANQSVRIASE